MAFFGNVCKIWKKTYPSRLKLLVIEPLWECVIGGDVVERGRSFCCQVVWSMEILRESTGNLLKSNGDLAKVDGISIVDVDLEAKIRH
jgi:hypothetical protein